MRIYISLLALLALAGCSVKPVPVSYTHLTLPTTPYTYISLVPAFSKRKRCITSPHSVSTLSTDSHPPLTPPPYL